MSTYAEVKAAAENEGTEKSLKFRKSARRFIFGGTVIVLLAVATVSVAVYMRGSGFECGNKKHQCTAERDEKVAVPEGKLACFDSSYWDNLSQLGFTTSYKGDVWNEFSCTQEQVMAGTCHQRVFDAFRFTPKGAVRIPKYWFVPAGTSTC